VYRDPRVAAFVRDHAIAVRVHIREHADEYKRAASRFGVQWTPTVLMLDEQGEVRHRLEGFVPADEFLAQMVLGSAQAHFGNGRFDDAAKGFDDVVSSYASSDAAAEALYWAGVSRYKSNGDASALAATAREFRNRYTDSIWAKKASVWE
jgi:hypothetical protein